jgi:NAD(P)-dependent dehydrogenase (short-subunit alcohol dehydrogenase family)
MANDTQTRVAWIAGVGASAGLGGALARRFAKAGFAVALTGRSQERVEALASELRNQGATAHALVGDVGSEREVLALAGRVQQLGKLEAAIFNASGFGRGPLLELSAEEFEQAWRTTTFGGFLFGREALRLLVAAGSGTLLITGATASLRGKPPFTAFAAAKAGLRSLSQSFAREFGPQGIHVAHVVIDGGIDGERLRSAAPERAAAAGEHGLLAPDAIAETYYQLHLQHPSAWTQELDLRPFKESF